MFQEAKKQGINITIHAAEEESAFSVEEAMEVFLADRIGHGYRVFEDEKIYKKCLDRKIHFETCPHSSFMTGAYRKIQTQSKRHPILRYFLFIRFCR